MIPEILETLSVGPRPMRNDGSVRVLDRINNNLYVYGGIKWRDYHIESSPLRKPTSDFFALHLMTMRWVNHTNAMRCDVSNISPFSINTHTIEEEPHSSKFPTLKELPALHDPIGDIAYDESNSKTPYLLLLGTVTEVEIDRVVLLCINLRLNTWRELGLRGTCDETLRGRDGGHMAITGMGTRNVMLSVFGGVKRQGKHVRCFDTFAVADLSAGRWIETRCKIPPQIGELGYELTVSTVTLSSGNEVVLLFKGCQGQSKLAEFQNAFRFDPLTREFELYESEPPFPDPSNYYSLQHAVSKRLNLSFSNTFIFVCWKGRAIDTTKYEEDKYDPRCQASREMEIWKLNVNDYSPVSTSQDTVDNTSTSSSQHSQASPEISLSLGSGHALTTQKAKRSKLFTTLATASTAHSYPDSFSSKPGRLAWEKLSIGRLGHSLQALDDRFSMVQPCLVGSAFCNGRTDRHRMNGPNRLVLIGNSLELSGEVRCPIFNAYVPIDLPGIDDQEETLYSEDSSEASENELSSTNAIRHSNGFNLSAFRSPTRDAVSDYSSGTLMPSSWTVETPSDAERSRQTSTDPNVDPDLNSQIQRTNVTVAIPELNHLYQDDTGFGTSDNFQDMVAEINIQSGGMYSSESFDILDVGDDDIPDSDDDDLMLQYP